MTRWCSPLFVASRAVPRGADDAVHLWRVRRGHSRVRWQLAGAADGSLQLPHVWQTAHVAEYGCRFALSVSLLLLLPPADVPIVVICCESGRSRDVLELGASDDPDASV